jgi:hypothetical protein
MGLKTPKINQRIKIAKKYLQSSGSTPATMNGIIAHSHLAPNAESAEICLMMLMMTCAMGMD